MQKSLPHFKISALKCLHLQPVNDRTFRPVLRKALYFFSCSTFRKFQLGPVVGSMVAPALALCFCPLSKICKVSQHQLQLCISSLPAKCKLCQLTLKHTHVSVFVLHTLLHLLSGTRLKSNIIFRYFLLQISSETQLIQNSRDSSSVSPLWTRPRRCRALIPGPRRNTRRPDTCAFPVAGRRPSFARRESGRGSPGVQLLQQGVVPPPRHLRLTSLLLHECQSTASRDLHDCNQSEWQSEPGGSCVLFNLGRLGGGGGVGGGGWSQPASQPVDRRCII